MGWNRVEPRDEGQAQLAHSALCAGHAYFANSYRVATAPRGWELAWCDYGGPFVAAMQRGAVLACQFHPELSGAYGAGLIHRWLEATPC
jgi:imidazole glycerol-phosphate synthase subunit HisH